MKQTTEAKFSAVITSTKGYFNEAVFFTLKFYRSKFVVSFETEAIAICFTFLRILKNKNTSLKNTSLYFLKIETRDLAHLVDLFLLIKMV